MDISNQRILVIGGSGLVGKAICRSLLSHPEQQPAAITITGRSSSRIEKTLDELKALSATTEFSGITGDIFCRSAFKDMGRKTILSQRETRERYLRDIIDPLNQEILNESYLYRMIQEERPNIVIDSVNTATAIAYQDLFSESRCLLKEVQTVKSAVDDRLLEKIEFETLSEEGLMEMITPEDIANEVLQCLQGGNSGHDIVSALDSSILGPTFRGGYMRERALESLRYLEKKYDVPSIAFENLGPPKLAKLLYEIFIIEKHINLLEPIKMDEKTLSERCVQTITDDSFLRQSSLSVGLAIVLPGNKILRGEQLAIPSQWEYPEKGKVSLQQFNQFADKGWIDLRPTNMKVWIDRLHELQKEIASPKEETTHEKEETGSNTIRNQRFWQQAVEKGNLGSFISWIFLKEDNGERIKK
ncbi:hypothetical protein [Desulfobacter postgatei]|uniref:Uncharacterized protein n=1 Tax=Desulfobacter postgatei 2ac9 TaxID=879212 RepID=I5B5J1_9BACT|nr:hypothetical protein [Desulfobacter postgatei]EIM64754.1 hypothetical protein DespoDRAFT_02937 [Desulfobacter postgatei 2ac9]